MQSIYKTYYDVHHFNLQVSIGSTFLVTQDVHQSIALAANSIGLQETPAYKVTTGFQSDWIENSRVITSLSYQFLHENAHKNHSPMVIAGII